MRSSRRPPSCRPFASRRADNFASSADWVDVERIIVWQTGKLDWNYISEQLRPLAELKNSPEILDQLERRRREFEQ